MKSHTTVCAGAGSLHDIEELNKSERDLDVVEGTDKHEKQVREAESGVVDPIDDVIVSWIVPKRWVATKVVGVLPPADNGLVINPDVTCLCQLRTSCILSD